MSQTIENLNWRNATKAYDTNKKLSDEQLEIITEALRLSPSSFGLQPWKFIHVTDKETREKLKASSWNQTPITDASDIFVLCSLKDIDEDYINSFIAESAKAEGKAVEDLKGYKDMMVGSTLSRPKDSLKSWMAKQVYIALGFALEAAAENKIDSTPMEGFDATKYGEILGLDALGLDAQVVLALGFRSADYDSEAHPKVRFPKEKVFIEK